MRILVLTLGVDLHRVIRHSQSANVQQINKIVTPEAALQPLALSCIRRIEGQVA